MFQQTKDFRNPKHRRKLTSHGLVVYELTHTSQNAAQQIKHHPKTRYPPKKPGQTPKLVLMNQSITDKDSALTAEAAHERWQSRRRTAVTSPLGNLALIETRWFAPGYEVSVEQVRQGLPKTVRVTELSRKNLDTGVPEYGVRFWDSNSSAIKKFETIAVFPYAPGWVIDAVFTPVDENRTIPFEHIRDSGGTRELIVPGDITFNRDGDDYQFSAFKDGERLLLVFGDSTNGVAGDDGTYSAGRFLFVTVDGSRATLDFNRAFVPPCGFSDQYNCPMPPANNRFSEAVRAGEKKVIFRNLATE